MYVPRSKSHKNPDGHFFYIFYVKSSLFHVSALVAGLYSASGVFLLLVVTSIRERRLVLDKLLAFVLNGIGVLLLMQPWTNEVYIHNRMLTVLDVHYTPLKPGIVHILNWPL